MSDFASFQTSKGGVGCERPTKTSAHTMVRTVAELREEGNGRDAVGGEGWW